MSKFIDEYLEQFDDPDEYEPPNEEDLDWIFHYLVEDHGIEIDEEIRLDLSDKSIKEKIALLLIVRDLKTDLEESLNAIGALQDSPKVPQPFRAKSEIAGDDEFPQGRENYCPQCYFEDEKVCLKKLCTGH